MSITKDSCVFCKKFDGVDPEIDVIGFEPLNPVTPGHWLVVPRKHVTDYTQDLEVTAEVMKRAAELGRKHSNSNLITSNGKYATQSIRHLHVHIIPRRANDGLHLPWTNQFKGEL